MDVYLLFAKDVFNHTEPYRLYLVNPEGQVLCALNSLDESATLSATLNDRWTLNFTVEKYIDIDNDGTFVLSNGYDALEKGMEIFVENIGYFVISEVPTIQNDGYSETKSITADSCDIELESKDLISFYVNTGKTGSKEYMDEDNVITDPVSGQKLLTRYVALYDPDHPKLSLLDLVLENLPNWSVGHVDESYVDEDGNTKWYIPYTRTNDNGETEYFFVRGQFEEESINVYAFLTQTVSQAYRCVFVFDILNRKINCYHVSQLGKDTGIYLSNRNYIDSITVSGATNDIYTSFNVAGGENLDISYVNFGSSTIDNLSHVLKEPIASQELIEKYEAYLSYRGTHWDKSKNTLITIKNEENKDQQLTRREYYAYASKLWGKYKKICDELQNRQPNDGLNTDWDTFTKEDLEKQLSIYIDAVNFILLQYGYAKRDEDGKLITDEDGIYETTLTGDDLKAQMYKDNCWFTYTAYVDNIIPNIKIAISNIYKEDDDKTEPIDAWETQWELYGIDALKIKIQTYQNTIDACKENGYDQPYDASENMTDYYAIYQEAVTNKENAEEALSERQAEYDENNTLMEQAAETRSNLVEQCKLINKQFGFVDDDGNYNELGKAILKLYNVTDYVNENYLLTSLDDIETTVDQAEDLYLAATEELSSQCQPQYTYETTFENLLCDENFSDKLPQLVLGNFIWLEISDGNEFAGIGTMEKLRLYTMEFNPLMPSESLNITFTNILKSQSKRDDEVFLLNSQTKTGKNQITSPTYTGVDEDLNVILTPELLKALSGKLATTPQFGTAVGNVVEYINSQPNSVLNITASQLNVNKITGTEAQFEQFFAKYVDADYINARVVISDVGEFKNLYAEIANIKNAIIGTSATETGLFINLNAQNATIDSAWIASLVAGQISVGDLMAGDITISDKMRILSENGNMVINGSTMQFLNPDGDVGIQIGYGENETPSIIIKDENGTSLWTSTGVTKDAIADGLIVNDMLSNNTISKDKLNFPIVEANDNGGIDITQIYDGSGNLWGLQYDSFKETVNSNFEDLQEQIDNTVAYSIQITASAGRVLGRGIYETTITAHVYKNGVEVTDSYDDSHFIWSRESSDSSGDIYFNEQHEQQRSKSLTITKSDILYGATFGCSFVIDGEVLATSK